jgi:hypothetical protein
VVERDRYDLVHRRASLTERDFESTRWHFMP